tara:strand:- start:448 stop:696 length:249 start_codon:yes stop_codon:yes gene_type:complete
MASWIFFLRILSTIASHGLVYCCREEVVAGETSSIVIVENLLSLVDVSFKSKLSRCRLPTVEIVLPVALLLKTEETVVPAEE